MSGRFPRISARENENVGLIENDLGNCQVTNLFLVLERKGKKPGMEVSLQIEMEWQGKKKRLKFGMGSKFPISMLVSNQ